MHRWVLTHPGEHCYHLVSFIYFTKRFAHKGLKYDDSSVWTVITRTCINGETFPEVDARMYT